MMFPKTQAFNLLGRLCSHSNTGWQKTSSQNSSHLPSIWLTVLFIVRSFTSSCFEARFYADHSHDTTTTTLSFPGLRQRPRLDRWERRPRTKCRDDDLDLGRFKHRLVSEVNGGSSGGGMIFRRWLPGEVDTHPTLPSSPIHLIGFSWVVANSNRCCFTFKKKHRFLQRPNGVSAGSSESSFLLQFLGCFFRDKSSLNLEVGVLRCEHYQVSMAFCTVPICFELYTLW